MSTPTERHRRAARWHEIADRLPDTDPRADALRALAREQRNRASLAQHQEFNDMAVVRQSSVLPGTVRRRVGARAQ